MQFGKFVYEHTDYSQLTAGPLGAILDTTAPHAGERVGSLGPRGPAVLMSDS